ncbi:BCCT family transporter [Ruegeria sp. SCP11]|uniref:BCCT family transporter n=1 Tax=Ruegeria sp. SCP11 TaxID=3141378 RepID=UPI003337752A
MTETTEAPPRAAGGYWSSLVGEIDHKLFWATAAFTLCVVAVGISSPDTLEGVSGTVKDYLSESFGWFYLFATAAYIVIGFGIAFSRYGNLTLGAADEKPEFSFFSWVAMLFSCGIGVGYILWAVAEPLYHYMQTPYLAEPGTPEALPIALNIATLHWGFHTWMIYSIVGLCIAFPAFRYGKPMTIGISLYGLLGERTQDSLWAKLLDFLGAFATIGGVSTTLGFGIISLNYGISHLFGVEIGTGGKLILMTALIALYIFSAMSGLKRGIQYLSNFNVITAIIWGSIILIFGPTTDLLNYMVHDVGGYISNFAYMSFWTDPIGKSGWLNWWTVFFILWATSWAPFTGGFIARISRGRTIREYVLGAVIVPTAIGIVWFSVVGGSAIYYETNGTLEIWEAVQADVGAGIYVLLEAMPWSTVLSYVVFINMAVFLVTSADSASFFVAMQMAKGEYEPKPGLKVICGLFLGSLAMVLLMSGGLKGLQAASIVAGSPFAIAIIVMIWSLLRMLRREIANPHL